MEGNIRIRSALISVYHKENLEEIVQRLHNLGVLIYSTGGTSTFIETLGIPVHSVEDLTGYPSILGGRVKTLHPRIFGGILARRENVDDLGQLKEFQIPEIDLVIVDLYPFEETVATGAEEHAVVEKIDIGGISLLRAAAKNFRDVLVVPSRDAYLPLLKLLTDKEGISSAEDRRWFAARAFGVSSHYDAAIFRWIGKGETGSERISLNHGHTLRYGENPHQNATFFRFHNTNTEIRLADAGVLQGKELSYNNMLDADAAWKSASDALHSVALQEGKFAVSVIKHLNPCGLAVSGTLMSALELAWAGDPVSAYGSIVCLTGEVHEEVAGWFDRKFVEILIAPAFSQRALEILARKKNLRLLVVPVKPAVTGEKTYRSISGGMLVQDEDEDGEPGFTNVTEALFHQGKLDLARFGVMACKNLKSNAIALVSETEDGSYWLTGAGMGQPNRLDSLRQLTIPRFGLKQNVNIRESVLVSDAYFPFRDSIDAAREYDIRYIVQPGGSIRDREVIDACNESGIAMIFTGRRHFRH